MSQPTPICIDCSECPFRTFTVRFLLNIAGFEDTIKIGGKFENYVIPTYENNKPTNSLKSIAADFKNCIEPRIGSAAIITATELGNAIFFIVILTAVFMILVVVILGLIDRKQQPGIIIVLILFFAIIYIVVGWLLIHNSFLIISNEIINVEAVTTDCVNQAITDTEIYFANQEKAINDALCSYPVGANL